MTNATKLAIPTHIGIIPDGNRRWAKSHHRPSIEGHRQGLRVAKELALKAFDDGVEYFTMYAFSTENWGRTKEEVGYLMELFYGLVTKEFKQLEERQVRLRVLGRRDRLPRRLDRALAQAEERSRHYEGGTLALCLDYGGEQELVDALAAITAEGAAQVTPELITSHLYAPDIPPLDLVIRTSGEHRTSGFMMWRAAYAEYYFSPKAWPDFTAADLEAAITDYGRRTRRFGR
jgi:undecaprenyl diphosphate synthase